MPRNITRGELKPFNPMGNPDPNYGKREDPIKAHYEFDDYRLIVKMVTAHGVTGMKLFIEKKYTDALGNLVWTKFDEMWFPESEAIYSFTNEEGSILMVLAGILLYKRQDLLVDKMEAKPNA